MSYLQFTEFRNNSKRYFDNVEQGESYIVIRKGKPIARVIPFEEDTSTGWKRDIEKTRLKVAASTTDYIVQERNEE